MNEFDFNKFEKLSEKELREIGGGSYGEKIRNERIKLGLTQQQLANQLFLTNKAISNWEHERTEPDIQSLCMLSQIFSLTIDEIIDVNSLKYRENSQKNH